MLKNFFIIEANLAKGTESNLLTTICNYSNSSTPGEFPYLTELLDNFEVHKCSNFVILN